MYGPPKSLNQVLKKECIDTVKGIKRRLKSLWISGQARVGATREQRKSEKGG